MSFFVIVIVLTFATSFLCSILEAFIMSTTTAEVESLKKISPKQGQILESLKKNIDKTSAAILALNTIANTLGSVIIGGIAAHIFGENQLLFFSIGLTVGILIFSEILPTNIGILYRKDLQKYVVYPLMVINASMSPISWFCKKAIHIFFSKKAQEHDSYDEIALLAEKGAKEGTMSMAEFRLISNALNLDKVLIQDIMTPRTVVMALDKNRTVDSVLSEHKNIPFARIPVFEGNIDKIVGLVRRRELLTAMATDKENVTIASLMQKNIFLPETVTVGDALTELLKHHQHIAVVADEFGSVAGVVALEDIFEYILGQEIFEKDDIAVDMRELARKRKKN